MASSNQVPAVAKITVQIWRPISMRFDAAIERACLRRDAWLARVLDVEVDALDAEVPYPSSEAARKLVGERLSRLERKLVSIKLPHTILARLDEVCERKRIVRDAFFNRLFLLLSASPATIVRLFLLDEDWRSDVWIQTRNELFFPGGSHPLDQEINPLLLLRTGLEMQYDGIELEDAVDAASGMRYRVVPNLPKDLGFGALDTPNGPPDTIYSRYFDLRLKDRTDLVGLNTFLSHQNLLALTNRREPQSADLDALLEPPGESP